MNIIKKHLSLIINILMLLVVTGGVCFGYGKLNGQVEALKTTQYRIQYRTDASVNEIKSDIKKILKEVGRIEGKMEGFNG